MLLIIRSLRRQVHVHADVEQQQAGVDEVALPLDLARPQVGQQALPLHQVDAEERDRLPLPVAELAAGEVRVVEDRVEPGGVAVVDVAVAARRRSTSARNRTQSRS